MVDRIEWEIINRDTEDSFFFWTLTTGDGATIIKALLETWVSSEDDVIILKNGEQV